MQNWSLKNAATVIEAYTLRGCVSCLAVGIIHKVTVAGRFDFMGEWPGQSYRVTLSRLSCQPRDACFYFIPGGANYVADP